MGKKNLLRKSLKKYETMKIWSKSGKTCVEITAKKANTLVDVRCSPDIRVECDFDRYDEYAQNDADKNVQYNIKKDVDIKKYFQ